MRPAEIEPYYFNVPGISHFRGYARGAGQCTFSHGPPLELYRDDASDPSRTAYKVHVSIKSWIIDWQLDILALLLRGRSANGSSIVHG